VLRHIRLLIFDLDYVVYDCIQLKVKAVREGMIALAGLIPPDPFLPGPEDAEEGFLNHGFRWARHLQIGLDEQNQHHLQRACALHEYRLVESGEGRIFPGIEEFILNCRDAGVSSALGADASRDYLTAVIDRHQLDAVFQITFCTEEFGMGDADEMLLEVMRQAEVNPSETLVFGTRPHTFEAARALDILSVGCGWGIRQNARLDEADLQSSSPADLYAAVEKADTIALQRLK
jgi:phosphoglycolate phosphatase-like HAD superfamily hydrolase